MLEVDQRFADDLAEVARLLDDGSDPDSAVRRLVTLAVRVIEGCEHASITIGGSVRVETVAFTDERVRHCHDVQFAANEGPVVETLKHYEPRRVDDAAAERRWSEFTAAAVDSGLLSCLALPVRIDGEPAGALALYGTKTRAFIGASHDAALLFAAQGGTALGNAELYHASRRMIDNLHRALQYRAVIEQAKGILMTRHSCSADAAFELLRGASQSSNTKVHDLAARIVADASP
jgi:GAF domain-containing protein